MNEEITQYIISEFHGGDVPGGIAPTDDLLSSNLLGSMDMMRLIAYLETTYDFKVAPRDMTIDNFISVQAMTDFIQRVKAA